MQSCNSKCGHCARNFWNWLKGREAQMRSDHKGGTPFAEAARTSVSRKLQFGAPMKYKNYNVLVVRDPGFSGLDGRHWVSVQVVGQTTYDGSAWEMHVERKDLH